MKKRIFAFAVMSAFMFGNFSAALPKALNSAFTVDAYAEEDGVLNTYIEEDEIIKTNVKKSGVLDAYDYTGGITDDGFAYYLDGHYAYITDYSGVGGDIVIPEELEGYPTSIAGGAFNGCISITSVVIPEGVVDIGVQAFQDCPNIKSIEINCPLEEIYEETFYGCIGLTELTLPDTVKTIGKGAFQRCTSLQHVNIPEAVERIEDYTFAGCESLLDITIPKNVTSLGESAFASCSALVEIDIPGTITTFPRSAFMNCSGLKKIVMGQDCPATNVFSRTNATGVTIYYIIGKSGWTVEEHAWLKNYTLVGVKAEEKLPQGDIDANGTVNSNDAAVMLKKLNNPSLTTPIENVSTDYIGFVDMDGDKQLTLLDAIKILKSLS